MSEITHVASLFNPKIKESMGLTINDLPWSTEIARALVESGIKLPDATPAVIHSILGEICPAEDISNFVELAENFRLVTDPKEIEKIVNNFFKFYQERKLTEIMKANAEDTGTLIDMIREIPRSLTSTIPVHTLGGLDVDTVMEHDIGGLDGVFQSTLDVVTEASVFNGYIPGQVIQFVGRPGGGKSAIMLQEVLGFATQGRRTLWVALGDLTRYDFLSRATAVITGTPYAKVVAELNKHLTDDVREILNYIDLITVPSRSLGAEDLEEYLDSCRGKKRYDCLVVDYDSNLKRPETGSMYDDGGHIYDILTSIAKPIYEPARLVFVASQPKIQYWGEEELNIDSAGESARKQQNVDMMITVGLSPRSEKHCGILKVAKCRRGKDGVSSPWIMRSHGEIEQIGRDVYSRMQTYGGRGGRRN